MNYIIYNTAEDSFLTSDHGAICVYGVYTYKEEFSNGTVLMDDNDLDYIMMCADPAVEFCSHNHRLLFEYITRKGINDIVVVPRYTAYDYDNYTYEHINNYAKSFLLLTWNGRI